MRYRILSGDVGEHFFRCVRIWRCHWRGLCIMRSMFTDGNKPLEATDTCRFNYAFIMRSLHVMSRKDLIFSGNIPYLTFCDCLKTEVQRCFFPIPWCPSPLQVVSNCCRNIVHLYMPEYLDYGRRQSRHSSKYQNKSTN